SIKVNKNNNLESQKDIITAKDIKEMSDDDFMLLKPDQMAKMTKGAEKAFEERRAKEAEEFEKSGDKLKYEKEMEEFREREKNAQIIAREIQPLIEEGAYGNDTFGIRGFFKKPVVTADMYEDGTTIVNVVIEEREGEDLYLSAVEDIDFEIYIDQIIDPLIWSDEPKKFNQLSITIKVHNWKEKGTEHEIKTVIDANELKRGINKEPEIEIEKVK
ncbi:hypothetical protein H7N39_002431, partial [Staphylococcus pseudintermedius]|nr:hypothetical protein [Staphylococcus pseudintermedius]